MLIMQGTVLREKAVSVYAEKVILLELIRLYGTERAQTILKKIADLSG